MYKLIYVLSFLIRQFCLPNPFECFGDMAIIYNLIAGAVLVPVAYALVGTIYDSGSAPALGSLLFLGAYVMLSGMLWLLGQAAFAWWAILGMIAAIAALVLILRKYCDSVS